MGKKKGQQPQQREQREQKPQQPQQQTQTRQQQSQPKLQPAQPPAKSAWAQQVQSEPQPSTSKLQTQPSPALPKPAWRRPEQSSTASPKQPQSANSSQPRQPLIQQQQRSSPPGGDDAGYNKLISDVSELSISKDQQGVKRASNRRDMLTKSDYALVSRPRHLQTKQGKTGRPVKLCANYFCLRETYEKGLNAYHVDFTPDLETRQKKLIISRNKSKFGGYIFDGTKLYTKLAFDDLEFVEKMQDSAIDLVKVNIKFICPIHMMDSEWFQLFNIILRRCMDGLKLQLIGRNLFDALSRINLRDFNLEIWPGYVTSIRQHERNLLLCCDIVHKVMRNDSLWTVMNRLYDQTRRNQGRGGNTDFKTLCKNEILGAIVLTDYNNKTYRVDDIDFESNPKSLFQTNNGNISYVDYYKRRYNIQIRDANQPLLISRPMDKTIRSKYIGGDNARDLILLVPELCRATGLTDAMRNDRKLMTEMARHTRVNPYERVQRLKQFQERLTCTKESASTLDEFNMKIDSNLVQIPGRVLPESTLVFANSKTIQSYEWEAAFRSNRLLQGSNLNLSRWIAVVPSGDRNPEINQFIKCCQDIGRKMSFMLGDPDVLYLRNEQTMEYARVLEEASRKDPQIIMVFVNTNRADIYTCIKKKLCCDRAVPSQVMRTQTIRRPQGLPSVATKVCVQMCSKLRFAPWTVKMPNNVMCIGFDVCHSTKNRSKSYGALVASMDVNSKPGSYFSAISEHDKGVELSHDITINVVKALRTYKQEHQKLPTYIFFYRDGVGEGQLHQVYEQEIVNVRQAIEKIYNESKAGEFKLCYVVVNKRINTRIFANDNSNYRNPEPGTIVDDVITLPQRYDFYLISQSVRQGTVSPTSYNVLFDNTKLPAELVQDMTYRQTHMYFNYFATIRVPAVCQYAHKLAFLVGQYLHQIPNSGLEKNLYYL